MRTNFTQSGANVMSQYNSRTERGFRTIQLRAVISPTSRLEIGSHPPKKMKLTSELAVSLHIPIKFRPQDAAFRLLKKVAETGNRE
jgi:hypothetical protein